MDPQRPDGPSPRVRAAIVSAAILVAAEAVALVVFALLDLASVSAPRIGLGVGTSLFFLAYAAGQGFAAWGVLRLRGWSRGPVLFTQLIQLGLAWNLRGADLAWLAPVMAVLAVVVLACVLAPPSVRAFAAADPPDAHLGGPGRS